MLVAIGSRNPAKTLGVRRVFPSLAADAEFIEVDTASVAKEQPFNFHEILEGARTRAGYALRRGKADFGVGIEAGVLSDGEKRLNLQLAVVMDARGRYSVGSSAGFMLPGALVARMKREGRELDGYTREISGGVRLREVDGIVYHLSGGRVSRLEMTEQCMKMAITPWLNRELYGL